MFYGQLLGIAEQSTPPELAKRGGCRFESGTIKVHCGVETPFTPAKKAHIAFRVADVKALAARLKPPATLSSTTTYCRNTTASSSMILLVTGWNF
jgi:hypothetical protein